MSSPSPQNISCRVVGGEKLLAESGGSDAICAAISRAAAAGLPDNRFSVEVRVHGSSSLAATLTTADGIVLPERRFSISDRGLTAGSLQRFAKLLVDAVARSSAQ